MVSEMYDYLAQAYGHENVFVDLDRIRAGHDFREQLTGALEHCDAVLVVIGPTWLNVRSTEQPCGRRIDDPADFVRIEIETAIARQKRVIPVLIKDASLPDELQLPPSLRPLVSVQAARVRSETHFRSDMQALVLSIANISRAAYEPSNPVADGEYAVKNMKAAVSSEYRLVHGDLHFGSFIETRSGDLFVRLHPDRGDRNGWGTCISIVPFIAGVGLPGGSIVRAEPAFDGILVESTGKLQLPNRAEFGSWRCYLRVGYDPSTNAVIAQNGLLDLSLNGELTHGGSDLVLCRLISNLLVDVPLKPAATGITGDIGNVHVNYGTDDVDHNFTWQPDRQPAHCPAHRSAFLAVHAIGTTNSADTASLGHSAMEVARKPGLKLTLQAFGDEKVLAFCGFFDQSQAKNPFVDNLALQVLVPRSATKSTHLRFRMAFFAVPPG